MFTSQKLWSVLCTHLLTVPPVKLNPWPVTAQDKLNLKDSTICSGSQCNYRAENPRIRASQERTKSAYQRWMPLNEPSRSNQALYKNLFFKPCLSLKQLISSLSRRVSSLHNAEGQYPIRLFFAFCATWATPIFHDTRPGILPLLKAVISSAPPDPVCLFNN